MSASLSLACIADDFTGATDLANNLVRAGWRTLQLLGLPEEGKSFVNAAGEPLDEKQLFAQTDAVVVALKSRTIDPLQAQAMSLRAWQWLQARGAKRCYFKVCSTFDSTDKGNIGPVADALMEALRADFALVCPAFPAGGRTVFRGHLFVGDQLLSDSGMKDHPLTPMTDSNLVRVLQRQSKHRIGLIDYQIIAQGPKAIAQRIEQLKADGVRMAIADATSDQDLHVLGKLVMEQSLVVAGSGIAIGFEAPGAMGQNLSGESPSGESPSGESPSGEIPGGHNPHGQSTHESVAFLPRQTGPGLILSGSCSLASQAQVKHFLQQSKTSNDVSLAIDPLKLARDEQAKATWMQDYVACLARLFEQTSKAQAIHAKPRPPRLLVYATAQAESVKQVQDALGIDIASAWIESLMADLAKEAKRFGVRRFVVAGGETSGAVVQALDVKLLKIGAQIDPGVPWTESLQGFALALKSGNFGAEDFFTKALDLLDA
ncbi:MAG: 3-oxo-tetronate kinase [Burkholderiaceae bacterium]